MLADVRGLDRTFDYSVPATLGPRVGLGSVVRIDLHGRRVRAWVIADDVTPPAGVALKPIAKVTGWGPTAPVIELAGWAAWRWAGARSALLATATAERAVPELPPAAGPGPTDGAEQEPALLRGAFTGGTAVLRLPPDSDVEPILVAAARRGPALVVVPSQLEATRLARHLRSSGHPVALLPDEWAAARAGGRTVVGTRAAVWAPCDPLGAVVVIDEHDEGLAQQQAPTWHAREVAVERARRANVPCVLVSPVPSLEALAGGQLLTLGRGPERAGWPRIEVVDQRRQDPLRGGLISEHLARRLRSGGAGPAVCVLNRRGRARLLACVGCRELARCELCGAAAVQDDAGVLRCPRCDERRPAVCASCGRTTLRAVRRGVGRVREDLEVLLGEPVRELTAAGSEGPDGARVVVGTEAVLHQVPRADLVAFLDFDQELLAPRYRAAEEALALLARAGRLVGGRRSGSAGGIVVQTSVADHDVLTAAQLGDPGRFARAESARRATLRWPPANAVAVVSGAAAPTFVERLDAADDIEVLGPLDGRWLLRTAGHTRLCDALAGVQRPKGRLRIEVDPLRA